MAGIAEREIANLKRWRDVGDGPVTYTAGSKQFGNDVIVALREIERLRAERDEVLAVLKDWLHYAEENLSEFDDDPCVAPIQRDIKLCPRCESAGCIYEKIRRTRAVLTKATNA